MNGTIINNFSQFDLYTDEFYKDLTETNKNKWKSFFFIVHNDFDYNLLKKHNLNVEYQYKSAISDKIIHFNSIEKYNRRITTIPMGNAISNLIYTINQLFVINNDRGIAIKPYLSNDLKMKPLTYNNEVLTINENMLEIEMCSILFYLLTYYNVTITIELYMKLKIYIDSSIYYRFPFLFRMDKVMNIVEEKEEEQINSYGINVFNII